MGIDKPGKASSVAPHGSISARPTAAHRKGPILEPKGYRGLTLEEAARKTPPTTLTDTEVMIDMAKLRVDRQARLREALRAHDVAACLLITPHSLRYASGLRNCAIYQTHIPATYLFLPAEGASVLFDSQPGRFTGQELETIDEISGDLIPLTAMWASDRGDEWAEVWAAQMAALMARDGGDNRRLAIERLSPRATRALEAQGLEVLDAEDIIEPARAINGRPTWRPAAIGSNAGCSPPAIEPTPGSRRPAASGSGPAISSASTPTWWGRSATSPTSPAPFFADPARQAPHKKSSTSEPMRKSATT
jgi:hypothetical protein